MLLIILTSGVIAPAFFFITLMMTEVTNVVLISTLEVPLGLIFAFLMFREQPGGFGAVGAFVSTLGIVAIFALDQPTMEHKEMMMKMLDVDTPTVNRFLEDLPKGGEILTGIATFLGMISVQMSRKLLEAVPVGIFSVARMIVGVILFAIIALVVFRPHHFDDLVSPFLWIWMLVYDALIIVFGQINCFKGIKGGASSTDTSVATALTPIAGTLFAFLILEEVPNQAQFIGGIIIIIGIAISLFGTIRAQRRAAKYEKPSSFSGV